MTAGLPGQRGTAMASTLVMLMLIAAGAEASAAIVREQLLTMENPVSTRCERRRL